MTRVCASIAALSLLAGVPSLAVAEPSLTLRFPKVPGSPFANFSSVRVAAASAATVEIWLEQALAAPQVSTIRVRLNEVPLTPFVSVNPLPRGVRLVVNLGRTLSPEYRLRPTGENLLTVSLSDEGQVTYEGRFYLTIDDAANAPTLAPSRTLAPVAAVTGPAQHAAPTVVWANQWPASSPPGTIQLEADVQDTEGISRIVVEVNGKDVEEVMLQNGLPVRKQNGWIARTKLPGQVSGDSASLRVAIPIKIRRGLNVVAVRAENTLGLRTRIDRTIEGHD